MDGRIVLIIHPSFLISYCLVVIVAITVKQRYCIISMIHTRDGQRLETRFIRDAKASFYNHLALQGRVAS